MFLSISICFLYSHFIRGLTVILTYYHLKQYRQSFHVENVLKGSKRSPDALTPFLPAMQSRSFCSSFPSRGQWKIACNSLKTRMFLTPDGSSLHRGTGGAGKTQLWKSARLSQPPCNFCALFLLHLHLSKSTCLLFVLYNTLPNC